MHLPIHRKELNSLAWNAASCVWSSVFLSIHPKIWNTGTNGNCPRKIHLLKQNGCHPLFPTSLWNGFWEWEIVAGRSQFWLHIGSSFFDLLFIAFVITIIHTDLPPKTLSLCLFVKLKSLCSAHRESDCPPVNSYNKKKKLIHHFQRFTLSGDLLQDCRPFLLHFFTASPSLFCLLTSVPHCFSLSDSIKEPGIQTPKDGYSETFSSVTQSWLTLCDLTDCSKLGFPFLHHLPELAQTQVHQVGDVIQSSHPPLSASPTAFNLSQHQGLFQLRHESAIFSVSWLSE